MTSLTVATLLHVATMATGADAETYAKAYQEATASGTPMVVFVSTDWCAPCRQMKKHVLPEVRRRGALSKVAFAKVNPDRERPLAQALIGGGPVPQLLMYRSTRSGWLRRRLIGGQSVGSVEQFIRDGLDLDAAAKQVARTQEALTMASR